MVGRTRPGAWMLRADPRTPVRANPFFPGLTLLVPNVIALTELVMMITGSQLQVRLIEEPYLRRIHGNSYDDYTSKVGLFIPGIGLHRCKRPDRG